MISLDPIAAFLLIAGLVVASVALVRLTLQNARLLQEAEERAQAFEKEHERSETLLSIITELSASLDMDIVLDLTLALINRITGAEQSTIIIANPAETNLIRRASHGYTAPVSGGGEGIRLDLNEGLAGWVIRERKPALIDDIREDPRWVPLGETDHRSAIAIPLMLGAETVGALLLFHRNTAQFSEDQVEIVQMAAKQIAIAVNNAHIYLLIRDQAERLGGMLRSQQIEASRLRAILESVADGVLVTDAQGRISVLNHSAEKILSLAQDTSIGNTPGQFADLFGPAGGKWLDAVEAWSSDPNAFDEGETFQEEIQLENDRVVAVNLAPVFTPHEYLGTVSIFRDITHLVEVDRMKSEFVATVSHELRTPMTSIKGYADILLMSAAGELTEQQRSFLEVIKDNTERLNVLVSDLLEVSRIEAGRIQLDMQALDLVSLAGEVAADYSLRAHKDGKQLQIEVSPPPETLVARGDSQRIRQVLNNLIGNAYNYTPDGGRICVSFATEKGCVHVSVQDTGVGIPPHEQERVFERFYRGEAPLISTVAGTGLGLSIVKHLVELHGGEIWLHSTGVPGEGTTFFFSLPSEH